MGARRQCSAWNAVCEQVLSVMLRFLWGHMADSDTGRCLEMLGDAFKLVQILEWAEHFWGKAPNAEGVEEDA